MALFMTQFSYTEEAWAALAKQPADRRPIIRAHFEKVGGRLVEMYYCFGDYDGILIFEAPDDTAATTALVAIVNAGHTKGLKTTKLLSIEDSVEALHRAGGLDFAGPGR